MIEINLIPLLKQDYPCFVYFHILCRVMMTSFDLPTNYVDNPEALLKRTRAKLKKVLALELEDN